MTLRHNNERFISESTLRNAVKIHYGTCWCTSLKFIFLCSRCRFLKDCGVEYKHE